ncbi:MAG: type II secretion system F family protein [Aquimonas sp.]|nr:type II secretion system F family protein [Aquimonas sp.]
MPSLMPPLSDMLRSQLHLQLATLEASGIAPVQALAMLDFAGPASARVRRAQALLQSGSDLPSAGRAAGLFTPIEAAVLAAASAGGSPAEAHRRLGERAKHRHERLRAMRGRLLLPVFVLVAALVLLPLPAVMAGSLSAAAWLLRSLLVLAVLGAVLAFARALYRRQSAGTGGAGGGALEPLLLQAPLIGSLLSAQQVQRFFEHLALLLGSGLPAAEATRLAAGTLDIRLIRDDFAAAVPALQAGASLQQCARSWRFATDPEVIGLIASGEGSGRLPELLQRYAESAAGRVQDRAELLATWLPRLLYAALALWIASQLLGGAALWRPSADSL